MPGRKLAQRPVGHEERGDSRSGKWAWSRGCWRWVGELEEQLAPTKGHLQWAPMECLAGPPGETLGVCLSLPFRGLAAWLGQRRCESLLRSTRCTDLLRAVSL